MCDCAELGMGRQKDHLEAILTVLRIETKNNLFL